MALDQRPGSTGGRLHDWFLRLGAAHPDTQQAIFAAGYCKASRMASMDQARVAELYVSQDSISVLVSALFAEHKANAKGATDLTTCRCTSCWDPQLSPVGLPRLRQDLAWSPARLRFRPGSQAGSP